MEVREGYLKMEWIRIRFAVDAGTGQAVSMDATSERVGVGRRPRRPVGDAKGEGDRWAARRGSCNAANEKKAV
jgi:hypothetical protein